MIAWLQAVAVVWGVLAVIVGVPYAILWAIIGGDPLAAPKAPPPVGYLLIESGEWGAQDEPEWERPLEDRPPAGPAKGCRVSDWPVGDGRVYWGRVHVLERDGCRVQR